MDTIKHSALAFLLLVVMVMPGANVQAQEDTASTTDDTESSLVATLIERLQELMERLRELQSETSEVKQEIRSEIKDGLAEGMTDEDVKKIQEILATDSDIYPEGLVTGYFGPLTRSALQRFQSKFELKTTGTLTEETKEYLEELWQQRVGNELPPGLLTAPGIQKKIELRIEEGCDNSGHGSAFLCEKIRLRLGDDDDDEDEDDDDEDKDEDDDDEEDDDDDDDDDSDEDDDDDE